MPFDKEQLEAIQALHTNVLVSASAGAGKTGVLVARLTKRVVEDRVRVSRILAMTFTQAAAAEMKKRLAKELNTKFANPKDEDEKQWVQQQLIELESASITTIDSYCLTIIKKYFSFIGLDPATTQNILSEGEVRLFARQAYHLAMLEAIEKDRDALYRLLHYFSARNEDYDVLYDVIQSINAHAQASIVPEEWYESARCSYAHVDRFSAFPQEVKNAFFSQIMLSLNQISECIDAMKFFGETDPKVDFEMLSSKESSLISCIQAVQEENYSSYTMFLESLAEKKTKASGKNLEYTAARKEMEAVIKDLVTWKYDEKIWIKDHNDLTDITKTLVNLAESTWHHFTRLKQENASMDFSDMERYAYQIVTVQNGVAADILRDSFDEIMVDEFQDTSELQNAIIEKIAKKDNVFRVGDVKQSIYRFRLAKPQLMRSLMVDPNTQQITLRHNFRSMNSIVQFSNHLFQKIMNVDGCADKYDDKDTVSVGRDAQKEEIVPVTFALIEDTKPDPEDEEQSTAKQLKAEWIAKKMLKMIQDEEELSYRSFCVLVRSHNDKGVLRAAFEKYNIPYDIDAREGFYSSTLCQTILSLTRFLLNPNDEISLVSLLTSPMYQCSDADLAQMKITYGSIKKAVQESMLEVITDAKGYRDAFDAEGITGFLKHISITHDFYESLEDAQKANFDYLFEKMNAMDIPTLSDFLDLMEAGEDEKSSEAMSKGSDDDVVTVTTIHQSKGLQYPVVFLWSTSKNFFNDSKEKVLIDDTLKLGMNHVSMPYRMKRPTLQRIACEYRSNLEDLEEFTRLLYVAITRAEKRMLIVDTYKQEPVSKNITLSVLNARKGMSNLILSAMKDDPYMEIEFVVHQEIEKGKLPQRNYVEYLPRYQKEVTPLPPVSTPSSQESHILLPLSDDAVLKGKAYGTSIHSSIEALPNRIWTLEDLQALHLGRKDMERLMTFASSALYQKALTMHIEKEFPFYIETETMRQSGSMDFVAMNDEEIILIDFKTDHAEEEVLLDTYTPQMKEYMRALHIMYPSLTVHAYLYSFFLAKEIPVA